jgi:hypothetical protein
MYLKMKLNLLPSLHVREKLETGLPHLLLLPDKRTLNLYLISGPTNRRKNKENLKRRNVNFSSSVRQRFRDNRC